MVRIQNYFFRRLSLAVALGVAMALFSASGVVAARDSGLVITSDQLEMDESSEIATFIGAVVAHEGEMALYADRMVVYYFKKGKNNGRGGVHKVLAIGNVIIEQAANKGKADRAEYIVGERKLILIGKKRSASIFHGGDRLSGKRILLVLGESRKIDKVSVLGAGKQRVSARILPSSIRKKSSEKEKRQKAVIRLREVEKPVSPPPPPPKVEQNTVEEERRAMQLQFDSKPLAQSASRINQNAPKPKRRANRQDTGSSPIRPPSIPPMWRVE